MYDPGHGRPVANEHNCHRRQRERYHALRALHYDWRDAKAGAQTIAVFCQLVRAAGRDPASYGELAIVHKGGTQSRLTTAEKTARRAEHVRRYHALRAIGADSRTASEGMGSELAFHRIRRELLGEEACFKKKEPNDA